MRTFCYHKRSFNRKEKVKFYLSWNIGENCRNDQNQPVKNESWFTWKRSYRFFSNFAYELCRLNSSNSLSFVIKCLTSFRRYSTLFKNEGLSIIVAMVTAVARKPMRKITFVICRKGGVVSRKSKFIFYAKFWFQKIHSKVKKTVASLLKALVWTLLSVVQLFKNQTSRGQKRVDISPWLYVVMKQLVG